MQKNMINFIKFIIDEFGEVEFEGEAVVVGVSLGELLWLRDAVDNLNFRHDDFQENLLSCSWKISMLAAPEIDRQMYFQTEHHL